MSFPTKSGHWDTAFHVSVHLRQGAGMLSRKPFGHWLRVIWEVQTPRCSAAWGYSPSFGRKPVGQPWEDKQTRWKCSHRRGGERT